LMVYTGCLLMVYTGTLKYGKHRIVPPIKKTILLIDFKIN
jgi:hypothetical protein